jgi:hypothetical protein
MGEEKPRLGRPPKNPPGTFVWSARVTERERKAILALLDRLRRKPGPRKDGKQK